MIKSFFDVKRIKWYILVIKFFDLVVWLFFKEVNRFFMIVVLLLVFGFFLG